MVEVLLDRYVCIVADCRRLNIILRTPELAGYVVESVKDESQDALHTMRRCCECDEVARKEVRRYSE